MPARAGARWAAAAALGMLVALQACSPPSQAPLPKTPVERLWHLARQAALDGFAGRVPPAYQNLPYSRQAGGLFVRFVRGHEDLGCQGFVWGVEDYESAVRLAAQNAAFHDPRYPPVDPQRLEGVELELTLVGRLLRMRRPMDFAPGRHALYLRYHSHSAFIQPSVAREHRYDAERLLDALALKAGLPPGAWRSPAVELYRAEVREYRAPFLEGLGPDALRPPQGPEDIGGRSR